MPNAKALRLLEILILVPLLPIFRDCILSFSVSDITSLLKQAIGRMFSYENKGGSCLKAKCLMTQGMSRDTLKIMTVAEYKRLGKISETVLKS